DTALVDGGRLARDDELTRTVVVCRPDVRDLAAERLDDLVGEPEDGSHRAGALTRSLGHREPALAHEPDRLGDAVRRGRAERGELTDRMADDEVGQDTSYAQRRVERKARRDQRGLLYVRLDELV